MSAEVAYHIPVMLSECIEGLAIKPYGIYIDLTFGGGGHSREILKYLSTGKLFAFDTDSDAEANASELPSEKFTLIKANFRYLRNYLELYGITKVDGILADLGISSHQIDEPGRGFSTRFDAPLDMRMNRSTGKTAAHFLANSSEAELHRILGMYGEVTNAKTLAAALVKARILNPILTTAQLKEILMPLAPRHREFKYFAQVFQALRIAVNEEMAALEEMLLQTEAILKPGGRLVIMSYHSLEDRLVKNYITKGKLHGDVEKDIFGNCQLIFKPLSKKPIEASEAEIQHNPRARSAKLRVGERL